MNTKSYGGAGFCHTLTYESPQKIVFMMGFLSAVFILSSGCCLFSYI